mgnify:CR=1 FL=1
MISIGIKISAELSEVVDWELTISSKTSLSRKIYKSRSNNVEVYWYGNSDRLPFFGNEECEITFRILCSPIVKIPFEVVGKANFKKTHPNFGFLVRDFEGNGMYPINNGNVDDVANGWFDASVTFSYESDNPSPMGGRYLRMYKKQDEKHIFMGILGMTIYGRYHVTSHNGAHPKLTQTRIINIHPQNIFYVLCLC